MAVDYMIVGTRVRLIYTVHLSGRVEIPAGAMGVIRETYKGDSGRRYVVDFGDCRAVVFAADLTAASS